MARNPFQRILHSEDKGVSKTSGANGVLSRLWRQMLLDLNIGPARYGDLMRDFVTDIRNGIAPTRKDQTSARGNITKEFARPQMTWKVFMKALRFLQVTKVEFAIKCHYANGRTTTHGTTVDFGTRPQINQFLEELHVTPLTSPELEDEQVHEFCGVIAQSVMFPFESETEHPTGNNASAGVAGKEQPVILTADLYEARTLQSERLDESIHALGAVQKEADEMYQRYLADKNNGNSNHDHERP
jgi:hypothetical protein